MNIAVLVSGGVDSSVVLRLLKEQGHELTAFYLKIWLEDELSFLGECPWEDDLSYVRAVCEQANVPLEIVPFQEEYWAQVVAYTMNEVKAGRTPNPDMLCNARIKFGSFYDFLDKNYAGQFKKIATGHYAWIEVLGGKTVLTLSPDLVKDQTYFLSQLSQMQISRALFPIGKREKGEVRKLAEKFELPNAKRKDSQGICFLGKIPFDKFLEYHLGKRPGKLIEYETGAVLGEHDGFWYYTVGQRRGIKLSGGPWYVIKKDTAKNQVFISHGEHKELLARDSFVVGGMSWIAGTRPEKKELQVKIRHGAKMYQATVEYREDENVQVTLKEKDPGIAEGQFAVFYDGAVCLGGGVITK
ncbi:MAG: tRNA 2-thiouridine(34) synthase MnmA [Candidatus Moranbacteria bacterium]|nr:tRNA 2-thiouridine(34) synthase MnmA [Candidatus Moranbacteria bacterium]